MKRSSLDTTTSLSTNTKTTIFETMIKSPLKKDEFFKTKTTKIFNSFQKNNTNGNILFNQDLSSENDIQNEEITNSLEKEYSLSEESNISNKDSSLNEINSTKKELSIVSRINKHKNISKLPFYLKNKDVLKLKFINDNIKNKSLPEYSSDFIGLKLKKGINFPNIRIFSQKSKKDFILSEQKKLNRRCLYLNRDNKFISFGFYCDRDIIENSKELNKELIENDNDMDCDSDEDNIIAGINTCLFDIKKAIIEIKNNKNSISYIKKDKAIFY